MTDAVPVAGVGWRGTRRGRPRTSRCQSSLTRKRSPSIAGRQSPPVARTRSTCSATLARSSARVLPQSSTSGIAASWSSSACVAGSSPLRDTASTRRSVAAAGRGQGEDDVDHGEAGADEQDVAGAGAVAAYDVEGAGRPRVRRRRTASRRSAVRRPGVAGGGQPGGDDDRIGGELVPVVELARWHRPRGPPHADGAGADVAQRGRGGGHVEGVGQGLVEVAARTADGARRRRARAPCPGPGGPARRRSARGPAGSAVMPAAGHVEEVLVVGGAEGGPAPGSVGRVDEHDVDARCPAGGRCGRGGSRPGCRPRHHRSPRPAGASWARHAYLLSRVSHSTFQCKEILASTRRPIRRPQGRSAFMADMQTDGDPAEVVEIARAESERGEVVLRRRRFRARRRRDRAAGQRRLRDGHPRDRHRGRARRRGARPRPRSARRRRRRARPGLHHSSACWPTRASSA